MNQKSTEEKKKGHLWLFLIPAVISFVCAVLVFLLRLFAPESWPVAAKYGLFISAVFCILSAGLLFLMIFLSAWREDREQKSGAEAGKTLEFEITEDISFCGSDEYII